MSSPLRFHLSWLVLAVLVSAACTHDRAGSGDGGARAGVGGSGTAGADGAPAPQDTPTGVGEASGAGGQDSGKGEGGAPLGAGGDAEGTGEAGSRREDGGPDAADVASGGIMDAAGDTDACNGDDFAAGVSVTVHPQTSTILLVTWTQTRAADTTWLEFGFGGSSVMTSRPAAGVLGVHRDAVLGVPEKTSVSVRIVSQQDGRACKSKDYEGTTGAIPSGLPRPQVLAYDAARASPERWLLGAVEDSTGGCSNRSCYVDGLSWLYIMDRQGNIVWYWADPASNSLSSFPRMARDGEYLWIEKSRAATGVVKLTLDRRYYETLAIPDLADCIDVTTDGSLLYDANHVLFEMSPQGTVRTIWSCANHFGDTEDCYSNTVNWNPTDDTVLLSFPRLNTVMQIDRQTGTVVGQYGDAPGSYTFAPATWSFEFQHFPNITPQGTLLVSSHLPSFPEGSPAGPQQHAFVEFAIDRTNRRLVEEWSYSDGTEWPQSRGMAVRLPNGNTLGNYGTGGAIREITPDGQTVFHVKFDVPTGDDYYNKMLGNCMLIDDLYALNGGSPK